MVEIFEGDLKMFGFLKGKRDCPDVVEDVYERSVVRLMFGIGNNMVQGFSLVYEGDYGVISYLTVWYRNKNDKGYDVSNFSKVRFVDDEESVIVWKNGKVEQILISRSFMRMIGK